MTDEVILGDEEITPETLYTLTLNREQIEDNIQSLEWCYQTFPDVELEEIYLRNRLRGLVDEIFNQVSSQVDLISHPEVEDTIDDQEGETE
jgi:hypothetical protein